MHQSHPARGFAPTRRSISLTAVALAALLLVSACNDNDHAHAGAGTAGANSAGTAGANSAGTAGANSAGTAGANSAGTAGANSAGAGGADPAGQGGSGDAVAGDGGAGAGGGSAQATSCAAGGTPFVVGNYVDRAGNQLVLRTAAKATTFALLSAGAANPALPPRLFLVERVCAPGGALIAKDESSAYRVDFLQAGSQFALCLSAAVSTLDAALALPAANVAHAADTGCAGKPFTVYTAEAL